MPVTLFSKEIAVIFTYCIIIVAGILNIIYAHDDFKIMITIRPAVRFSLIINEKHLYYYSIKNVC